MRGTPIQVNKALTKPILYFGVDKAPLCLYGVIAVTIIYATRFNFPWSLLGVVVFLAFHALTVWGHKKDPKIFWVVLRHFRYKGYYTARSFVHAPKVKFHPKSLPTE